MATLLSEAAQRRIDEARAERDLAGSTAESEADFDLDSLLAPQQSQAPVAFTSKAAARTAAQARRAPYTADAMVQLMIAHPEYTHEEFAAHFGYRASWFAGILVSPNFQMVLDPHRHLIPNPMLTGTMNDILRSMVVQSVTVLQARLEDSKASEDLIIKAIAVGVKALGMGTTGTAPAETPVRKTLNDLASSLSTPKLIEATPARDWTIDAALGELPR